MGWRGLGMLLVSMTLNGFGTTALLYFRAAVNDRPVLATTGDLIVMLILTTAGAFVAYAALIGGSSWDAAAELRRRVRKRKEALTAAVSVGAMTPNEARDVVNLADHRSPE